MMAISPGTIRTRVIPAFAITLVVLLLALLGWAMFAPKSQTVSENGRIDAPGVFVPIKGRMAPDFQLVDFSGKNMTLKEFRGKTVVINFWASWCDACKTEAPLLSQIAPTLDSSKVVLIGVDSLDAENDAQQFIQQYGVSYRTGIDSSGSVAVDYGISGMPETFIVGPDGKLAGKFFGAVTSEQELASAVSQAASQ